MDAAGVIRRVRTMVGDSGGSFVENTEAIDLINDAQLQINLEAKIIEATHAFSTVAGTFSYAVPATFMSAKRLLLADIGYVKQVSRNELVRNYRALTISTSGRGTPTAFSIDGMNIKLYPTPDRVISCTLEHIRTPIEITGTSDVLTLPTFLHPYVPRMVYALYKERDEDYEASVAVKTALLSEVSIAVAMALDANEETYPSVQDDDPMFYGNVYS